MLLFAVSCFGVLLVFDVVCCLSLFLCSVSFAVLLCLVYDWLLFVSLGVCAACCCVLIVVGVVLVVVGCCCLLLGGVCGCCGLLFGSLVLMLLVAAWRLSLRLCRVRWLRLEPVVVCWLLMSFNVAAVCCCCMMLCVVAVCRRCVLLLFWVVCWCCVCCLLSLLRVRCVFVCVLFAV